MFIHCCNPGTPQSGVPETWTDLNFVICSYVILMPAIIYARKIHQQMHLKKSFEQHLILNQAEVYRWHTPTQERGIGQKGTMSHEGMWWQVPGVCCQQLLCLWGDATVNSIHSGLTTEAALGMCYRQPPNQGETKVLQSKGECNFVLRHWAQLHMCFMGEAD